METVTAETAIRRRSVVNVDTDRLVRRRAFLVAAMAVGRHTYDSRADFTVRAAELSTIEDEMVSRSVGFVRRTFPFGAGITSS